MQEIETFKNPNVIVNGSVYTGKPLAYIDHNIISELAEKEKNDITCKLREKERNDIIRKLRERYQVVYSDENLAEIKRSGKEYRQRKLELFRYLNAHALGLNFSPHFNGKGKLNTEIDIFSSYGKYCNADANKCLLHTVNSRLLYNHFGGSEEYSKEEHLRAFYEHINECKRSISIIKVYNPELANECLFLLNEKNRLEMIEQMHSQKIANKEWKGFKYVRSKTVMSPKYLKNIMGPKILKKIWEFIVKKDATLINNCSIEEFYGNDKNTINPALELFSFQRVEIIYYILNAIGYFPDTEMDEDKGFARAYSDARHATMASFTNVLFSNDKSFYKKCEGIYEYLNVPIKINPFLIPIKQ